MASTPAQSHILGDEEGRTAGGWTRDGAVQDRIDDIAAGAVLAARASMATGESEPFRAIRGANIPERRRRATPVFGPA